MMIDVAHLGTLLRKIVAGSMSESDAVELVQLSRSMCKSHLEHSRPFVQRLAVQQGLTITDLAYDCLAEAFARDENDRFYRLQTFASSLWDQFEKTPDIEVFIAYRSFLARIADAQLARLYALSDPSGAKIHRNIREQLNHCSSLSLGRDFRGLVLQSSSADPLNHLDAFPTDELEQLFLQRASPRHTIPELLLCISDILSNQSRYRRSIPLSEMVLIAKKVYLDDGTPEASDASWNQGGELQNYELEDLRLEVETVLKEKILLTYFARGKVDRKHAEAMAGAFHDLLGDWCSSGSDAQSLFQYLGQHVEVDEDEYEEIFRSKMEYLLKLAREEFTARLMREL